MSYYSSYYYYHDNFFLFILSYYCCYDEDRIENDSKKPLKFASIQVVLIFYFFVRIITQRFFTLVNLILGFIIFSSFVLFLNITIGIEQTWRLVNRQTNLGSHFCQRQSVQNLRIIGCVLNFSIVTFLSLLFIAITLFFLIIVWLFFGFMIIYTSFLYALFLLSSFSAFVYVLMTSHRLEWILKRQPTILTFSRKFLSKA